MPSRTDTLPAVAGGPAPDEALALTLATFVQRNRVELIARCREKVAQRHAPSTPPPSVALGVPHFLRQLVDVLESEHGTPGGDDATAQPVRESSDIGRAAAVHGVALLQQGFSVDQVVHKYGDVCQAISELSLEQGNQFSMDEFRILNRSLDDAIADAVSAHQTGARQSLIEEQAGLHQRLHMLIYDHQRLVGIARQSFLAIKSGHVGIGGATGTLLAHALDELAHLSAERLPNVVDALRKADPSRAV